MSERIYKELSSFGIQVMTSGNHIWDKKEAMRLLDDDSVPLLRPHNYHPGNPGSGIRRFDAGGGRALWVVNLQGRVLMPPVDCPFRCAETALTTIPPSERCIMVDFHAEATSEKRALGLYLDGKVSAVIGSHTHVQTADEEVLPCGTGYLTDVGMTGSSDSIIGMEFDSSFERMFFATPRPLSVSATRPALAGVYLDIDDASGKCRNIIRIYVRD